MEQYKLESKKGDGAFSEVFKAKSLKTHHYVAIKCMKKKFDSIEKVKRHKQIQALKLLSPHDNIIKLMEVLYDQPTGILLQQGKLALVFQLMDINLYQCLKSRKLSYFKIKYYMFQLLKAIDYIHKKGIFHRDIKPQNVLLIGDHIKLADFGSCKGMYNKQPYTEYISTRWYRAPQCLMTDGYYDSKMDLWGFGCVLFEMLSKIPLFPGRSEVDQVNKINNILGTPPMQLIQRFKQKAFRIQMSLDFPYKKGCGLQRVCPQLNKEVIDLLNKLLAYDPLQRITAEQAIKHEYFLELHQEDIKNFRSTFCSLKPQTLPRQDSEDKLKNTSKIGSKILKNQVSKGSINTKFKKQMSKATIDDDQGIFPPIHQIGVDLKVNVYGHSTVKGDKFKQTLHGHYHKKKNEPIGYVIGKKAG